LSTRRTTGTPRPPAARTSEADGPPHNVRIHTTGVKLLHHPVVGDLDLPFESFSLAADPG
jgi:hypothetical protein